jgi:hypothetical protein
LPALLETGEYFLYLGRFLDKIDNDWPAINRNIKWARIAWGINLKDLSISNTKTMASMCKAVVKAVLFDR